MLVMIPFFFEKLVWEDIYNDIFIPDMPDHYYGPHGLKEGVEKLFQNVLECIMITSGISLEYFCRETAQSENVLVCIQF